MKYELNEEQFKNVEELAKMKDTVEFMMRLNIDYYSMSDLIEAYNSNNIKILNRDNEGALK